MPAQQSAPITAAEQFALLTQNRLQKPNDQLKHRKRNLHIAA